MKILRGLPLIKRKIDKLDLDVKEPEENFDLESCRRLGSEAVKFVAHC